MNQRQQDFIAGFICAGGSAEEAESQAAGCEELPRLIEEDTSRPTSASISADRLELAREIRALVRRQITASDRPDRAEALYLALWAECSPLQREQFGIAPRLN